MNQITPEYTRIITAQRQAELPRSAEHQRMVRALREARRAERRDARPRRSLLASLASRGAALRVRLAR